MRYSAPFTTTLQARGLMLPFNPPREAELALWRLYGSPASNPDDNVNILSGGVHGNEDD